MRFQRIHVIGIFIAIQFFLFFAASAVVAISYEPNSNIGYDTPVSLELIFEGLWKISPSAFFEAVRFFPLYLIPIPVSLIRIPSVYLIPTYLLSLVAIGFVIFGHNRFPRYIFWIQAFLLLTVGLGILGLISIGFIVCSFHLLDGEWLAEHFPQLEANGISGLISLYLSFKYFK